MVNEQTLHSRAGTLPKRPLAVETCNTYTPSSGASVFSESACGEHSFPSYCFFSHPPTPLHNSCLSSLSVSLSLLVNQPIPLHSGGGGGGGAHSFTAFSRSHWPFWCSTVGSDPTLSFSRGPCTSSCSFSLVGLAPPLSPSLAWALRPPPSLSLSLSCACGPCAPCSHIRALHSWCRASFSWRLSRSWHPPHAQKASCVCLTGVRYHFVWWELNFFIAWTIFMKLGTLVHHVHGYKKVASDFLIFVQGLSYGLPKSKKRGKIITKLWKIITKSPGKN